MYFNYRVQNNNILITITTFKNICSYADYCIWTHFIPSQCGGMHPVRISNFNYNGVRFNKKLTTWFWNRVLLVYQNFVFGVLAAIIVVYVFSCTKSFLFFRLWIFVYQYIFLFFLVYLVYFSCINVKAIVLSAIYYVQSLKSQI